MSGVQELRFRRPTNKGTADPKPPAPRHTGLLQDLVRRTARPPFTPSFSLAVRVLLLMRVTAAMYSNIADCDEVFNFWEPLHYLDRGYGFQTWETSPVYAIRSWAYILLHYVPAKVLSWAIREDSKRAAFFAVRMTLATASTLCEAKLYETVKDKINNRVGRYFLFYLLTSAGMWNAAPAFLPSSFAMYATTLAHAYAFIPSENRLKRRTLIATVSFAVGSIVGWPFALACAIPFVLEEMFVYGKDVVQESERASWSTARWSNLIRSGCLALLLAIPVFMIDSYFYDRRVFVPWNIVKYNVFPDAARGPDLYGTEPPHFYILNLLLNFNIIVPLALGSLPALAVTYRVDRKRLGYVGGSATTSSPYTLLALRLLPVYVWLGIMSRQAHKEERFMFPVYPLLCFNAAVTTYLVRGWLEAAFIKLTKSPYQVRSPPARLTLSLTLLSAFFSAARIAALYRYYHAPLELARLFQHAEAPLLLNATDLLPVPLPPPDIPAAQRAAPKSRSENADETPLDLAPLAQLDLRLCYAGEWHRFPGHYLVPDGVRVDWLKSAFDGMLPAHFAETPREAGLRARRSGTARVPPGLNDLNREEPMHYVDVAQCDYVVDLDLPSHSPRSPYFADAETYERAQCARFLDAARSPVLTRTLWVPHEGWEGRNTWGELCLLRNKARVAEKVVRVKREVEERTERLRS
ncbi:asparagine-linked glycosylation 9 protein isoform a [Vararia minispora EC-137]|uniref:Asparagine-linked glycosylation 9 protein isoform a n=1 Tax=Vararia minispora EC-137 TaxID=1314806 RepID=A0ACB8QUI3_9AGAM|nr:asparagine-linked glycosylation 9 protein isoform a [Vararia minispora EC-137]